MSSLPSQAILIIGGLGLLCVLLAALLAIQVMGTSPPQAETAEPLPAAAPAPAAEPFALTALPDETRASLLDAYDEPLVAELAALLEALHTHGAPPDGALRTYLADLAVRMDVEQEPYRARLMAPSVATAQRQAERLRILFQDAGLAPGLLTLTGQPGPDGVAVERS